MVAPLEEDYVDGPVPGISGEQQMKRQVPTYHMLRFRSICGRHVSVKQRTILTVIKRTKA